MESDRRRYVLENQGGSRRTFLIVLFGSIAFILALAGLYAYVEHITSHVTVRIDNKIAACQSREQTVGDLLSSVGFTVEKHDIVQPALDAPVNDDTAIYVQQVDIKREKVGEPTPFESVYEDDPTMNKGTKKVVQKGKKGTDLVTYKVTYTSGKETARKEVRRRTLKEPTDKVIHVGIRQTINGFAYTRKEVFQSTAYTGGGTTATGTRARVGEIAVDPSVIPLGTTVYVEGFGPLRAEDTGGAIKGHIIDIYMSSYSACRRWGRRSVTVYLP